MSATASSSPTVPALPDHRQLPDKDGEFVRNFQEPDQGDLLNDSLFPILRQLHPDNQFAIGRDCGIYWKHTDPPLAGCKSPDWYYVPHVPPMLDGHYRRSYVLWQERVVPQVVIEFASEGGREERDATPNTGKLWVYERGIRIPFYGIFDFETGQLTFHELVEGRYRLMKASDDGRYFLPPLGVELGTWYGAYRNQEALWLRWFDTEGNLLPTAEERIEQERRRTEEERLRAEQEKLRADQEKLRADQEKLRADQLAARLRARGADPDGG